MKERVWTYGEIQRLTLLWNAGVSAKRIARELAVNEHTVARKARLLGLHRAPRQFLQVPTRGHPLVRRLIAECFAQGVSLPQLADRSGLSRTCFHGWIQPSARKMPSLLNIEAAFNALGFDLVAVPRDAPVSAEPTEEREPAAEIIPICSPALSDVLDHASQISGVPITDIRKRCRRQDLSLARHIFCWLAREYTDKSYPVIARHIGLHDHTSAIYGHRRIAAMIASGEIERPAPPPAPAAVAPMRPALALEAAE